MSDVPFLQPRLTGPRFEQGAIPLEFLADLAVLEELVVEAAKWRFLESNPERRRVPRGFSRGNSLQLTGIGGGSAVAVIEFAAGSSSQLLPSSMRPYFEEARAALFETIRVAEGAPPTSIRLPPRLHAYFDRLGRSLYDGEAIEFRLPGGTATARMTKEVRRRLVLESSDAEEITEEISVFGAIPEADQRKNSFQLELLDGTLADARIETPHRETILGAFNAYKKGAKVKVRGVGRFDRGNRLREVRSIESIDVLDPLDVGLRLEELKQLKAGWLYGEGQTLDRSGLDWLADRFEQDYDDDSPLPYLYPTPAGGVRAEWTLGESELSLEVDLAARRARWHRLNLNDDSESEGSLDLDASSDWKQLADLIAEAAESKS